MKDIREQELIKMFLLKCDAYHALANMMSNTRHVSDSFRDCTEQTCTGTRNQLDSLGIDYSKEVK